jgi:hypothetical protein
MSLAMPRKVVLAVRSDSLSDRKLSLKTYSGMLLSN